MIETAWGILGPEKIAIERRSRTLGLGAAVRAFNDLAVPGMGNVYFAKQLVLAVLGVAVAQETRRRERKAQNIETANAIEALACRLAFEENRWISDRRLRGVSKLREKPIPTFADARKKSFYVTQPMRMATMQPLLELNLVEASSERFNAFVIAEKGQRLIDKLCEEDEFRKVHYQQNVFERLRGWASGDGGSLRSLTKAISPLEPLPAGVRQMLRGIIVCGDDQRARRRKAVLLWVERLGVETIPFDDGQPNGIEDDHWQDIESGGAFFAVRDAAIILLDGIEEHLGATVPKLCLDDPTPNSVLPHVELLARVAQAFIDRNHDPSPAMEASRFCRECLDTDHVIEHMVRRDDRVLRLSGGAVMPGPAFRGRAGRNLEANSAEDEEESVEDRILISGTSGSFSGRIWNMQLIAIDLQGSLSEYLEKLKGEQ